MLIIVAAIGKQGQLGLNKVMPWHNPEDLNHFKNLTMDKKDVFGSVTYENLPKKLKGREIFLVTINDLQSDEFTVIKDFKAFCQEHQQSDDVYYICGGESIYEQALPYTDEFYLSMIDYSGPADTFFPEVALHDFDELTIDYDTFTLYHLKRKRKDS